jgi:hypothetical protein
MAIMVQDFMACGGECNRLEGNSQEKSWEFSETLIVVLNAESGSATTKGMGSVERAKPQTRVSGPNGGAKGAAPAGARRLTRGREVSGRFVHFRKPLVRYISPM